MEDNNALYIGRITSQKKVSVDDWSPNLPLDLDEVNIVFLEYYSVRMNPINYLMFRRLYENMMSAMDGVDNKPFSKHPNPFL